MRAKTSPLFGLMALAGLLVTGCVIRTVQVADDGPPVEYGYQPVLYDGYVVYYTDAGVPFYWAGGVRVFVPVAYRPYYVDHWRSHRAAYVRWHSHNGERYRSRHYRDRGRDRGHHRGYKPADSRHKPVLHPTDRRDKPRLRPAGSDRHDSRPVLRPKEKKEKKEKKKEKKDKPTLKPRH